LVVVKVGVAERSGERGAGVVTGVVKGVVKVGVAERSGERGGGVVTGVLKVVLKVVLRVVADSFLVLLLLLFVV
jgi:hypothetical protein